MYRIFLAFCACLVLFLSGCAAVEKQAFNRQAQAGLNHITIIEPRAIEGFGVHVVSHPALGFGLIGGAIYATEMTSKSNSLDAVMKPFSWNLTDDLVESLVTELSAAGYKVSRTKVARVKRGLLENYKSITSLDGSNSPTDAWLDISTRDPLYVANSPSADYTPSVVLTVRLISSKEQTLLYREDLLYGHAFNMPRIAPVVIPADAKYRFPNHSDLLKNPEFTLQGVKEGVPLLAKRVAIDLAREGMHTSAMAVQKAPEPAVQQTGTR